MLRDDSRFDGDTLIDKWDWQHEKQQRDVSPIRGTQVQPTEQTAAPPICGRNIDQSVVAGVPNGVPIAPSSVTSINLAANPYPGTSPSFQTAPHNAGNTGVFDYVGAGSGAYDAITSFVIAAPPSMPGQTLGIKPPWLDYVRLYAVTTGSAFNTQTGVGIGAAVTDITARFDGTYANVRIPGLSAGTQYDIYAAYIDHSGQPGAAVLIGTTNANPLAVTPGQMPGIPSGLTFTAATTINSYGATTAGAYSVNATSNIVITANGGTIAQWLTEAQIFTSTDGVNWSYNTRVATTSVGNLSYTLDGLGAGQTYHIAVQLKAVNGSVSTLVDTGAVTTAQTIGNPALSGMPSAIKTNGPTLSAATASTRTNRSGMIQSMTVSFTETDFTAKPSWIDKIILTVRVNGDTGGSNQVQIDPGNSSTGTYNGIFIPVTRGDTVDVGIAYSDTSGAISATTWPSGWSAQSDGDGSVWDPSNNKQLLHTRQSLAITSTFDSTAGSDGLYMKSGTFGRRHVMGGDNSEGAGNLLYNPTGAQGTTPNVWQVYNPAPGGMTVTADRFQGGRIKLSTNTASSTALIQQYVTVIPSTTMTVSGYVEVGPKGTGATNSFAYVDLIGDGGFVTTIAIDSRSTAINGRTFFSKTVSITATQTYIYVRLWCADGGAANYGQAYYYRLKLEYGSVATPYSDDFSDGLVTLTHDGAGNLDHSRAQSGKLLPYANHATTLQNRGGGLHVSCSGQMPYVDASGVLHIPSTIIIFRPSGDYTRVQAGTTLAVGAWNAIYLSWVSTGNSGINAIPYNSANYHYIFDQADTGNYEILGYVNGDGPTLQFHASWVNSDHFSSLQQTFAQNGKGGGVSANNSTFLKNQGSIVPVTTPSVSASGSYPSGGTPTVTVAWSAGTYYFPDNTSVTISAGSTPFSGLSAGVTYYFTAYANTSGVVTVTNIGTSPPNTQQKYAINLDGRIPLTSQISCTTPSAVGGSSSGGSGGGTTCPSEDQVIWTREHGLIAARDVRPGMHVAGPIGDDVLVERVRYVQAQMMKLTAHGETFEVDTQHLWRTTDGWVRMCDLSFNMLLVDNNGGLHPIERIELSTVKTLCMIKVVGAELSLGASGLIAHNYGTL